MLKKSKIITKRNEKISQSTVEYIILVAAVIAVVIAFIRPGGIFNSTYCQMIQSGTDKFMCVTSHISE